MKKLLFLFSFSFLILNCSSNDNNQIDETPTTNEESLYFPPINSDTWETKTLAEAGWNESQLQPLLDFLDEKNTKGFIMLHNGKIVVESYMNGHNANSIWYWASAGKTLTATVSGIAQDEGFLNIENNLLELFILHFINL